MATYLPLDKPVVVIGPQFLAQYPVDLTVASKLLLEKMTLRWEVFKGESTDEKDLLFKAKKSSFFQLKTELNVYLANNTAEEVPDFKIKRSWGERSCTIYLGESNTIIAQMHENHTLKTAILEADSFAVTVYPNVDFAFVLALVVLLDEVNGDRSGED